LLYVSLPEPVATFTVARGYRSHRGWFFKRLAGGPGATVCRGAWGWSVDGAWLGNVQVADSRGRALPVWRGCFVVPEGHVVVVGDHPRSFDSRYFGAIAFHHVLAQAEALWTF
jgi:type IV secretory pathway protease TraF